MKKYIVTLTKEEKNYLEEISSKGKHKSEKVLNALILIACDEGVFQQQRSKNKDIARILNISMKKIDRLKKRFVEQGLENALGRRKSNRIYPIKVDGDVEAHLVALSCSEPPEGFARWSLRLLANRAVEMNYIDGISHETVRRILKKTKLSHGRKKGG